MAKAILEFGTRLGDTSSISLSIPIGSLPPVRRNVTVMHTAKSGGRHERCDPCSLPTGLDPAVAYLGFGLEDRPFDRLPCSLPPGSRSRIRTGVRGSPSWRRNTVSPFSHRSI